MITKISTFAMLFGPMILAVIAGYFILGRISWWLLAYGFVGALITVGIFYFMFSDRTSLVQ